MLTLSFFAIGFDSDKIKLTQSTNLLLTCSTHGVVSLFCIGSFFLITCVTSLSYHRTMEQLISETRHQRNEGAKIIGTRRTTILPSCKQILIRAKGSYRDTTGEVAPF